MLDEKDPVSHPPVSRTDEVIRIEDLTPREDVKGGRKIVLGEKDHVPDTPPE